MRSTVWTCALLYVSMVAIAQAENWGHWRGPTGNGSTLQAKPPLQWSSQKNVRWKVELPGLGSSSPIVWNQQVFVTTAVPVNKSSKDKMTELEFKLLCFDRANGKLQWEQTAVVAKPHQETHSTNGFASASPCTDGEHVYASFGSRGLFCYTMKGELKWKRTDFIPMKTRNSFGEGSSPTLEGNAILLPWDHDGPSSLYCIDKLTGKDIWKVSRDEPTCWATPLVVEHLGKKQVVMNGQNFARCYDFETGRELWRCGGQTERPIATAVAEGGMVFVGSGFRGSFLGAFRLGGNGDLQGTDQIAWTIKEHTPDVASFLLSNGRLYFHKEKRGDISCVDAKTGKPFYMAKKVPGISGTYASPVAAGGYVFLTGRSGTTVVLEDSPEFKIVATNEVDETVDATPAIADQDLFLRGEKHLFCISSSN